MARRILADAMGLPVEILEVRRRREHAGSRRPCST